VPTIARWPGKIRAGSASDYAGWFPDVLPTLAEAAGATAPSGLDGVSFLPTLLGQEQKAQPPYLYWEFYEGGSAQAVRMGKWKAIRRPLLGERVELYDLSQDLAEERDVAAANPDVVSRLQAAMDESHVPSPLWRVKK
jgi:arylsulfatase A-like enzyme